MKQAVLLTVTSAILAGSPFTFAGDLYRCGSTFQDTPCKISTTNQAVKKIPHASKEVATSLAPSSTAIDSDCKQYGETAKKIMWMREVGKTADDQVAVAPDRASQLLVIDVYNHRGSSLQVKNAIERECMQQKEKDKLAEKLMIEAERLRAGGNISPDGTSKNKASLDPVLVEKEGINKTSQVSNNKVEKCNFIKSSLDSVAYKRRKGGNAEYMDNLRREQNKLTSDFKSASC